MDSTHFDRLTRSVGAATTRRAALRGLAAGLIGVAGIGAGLTETDARKRSKGRCGKREQGCKTKKDCCEGLICKKIQPAGEAVSEAFDNVCAYKRGCGKKNAYCDKNRDCCSKFVCQRHRCKRRK